jgi:hypothetical protein
MAELTERQLRLAAAALHKRFAQEGDPMGVDLHVCMRGLEAAAPFLQFLWEEPTTDEIMESVSHYARITPTPSGLPTTAMADTLMGFVRRRNEKRALAASDLCNDPRHLAVRELLVEFAGVADDPGSPPSSGDYAEYAEKILAALDESK